jgi:hypothetical protein
MVQACFINAVALWVIVKDRERAGMNWSERVWGYTGATGMVQGFAAGYFLWDLVVSAQDVGIHGWGALVHAVSALAVSLLGFVSSSKVFVLYLRKGGEKGRGMVVGRGV